MEQPQQPIKVVIVVNSIANKIPRFHVLAPSTAITVGDLRKIILTSSLHTDHGFEPLTDEHKVFIAQYVHTAKLLFAGNMLTDNVTLASLNYTEGAVISMWITALSTYHVADAEGAKAKRAREEEDAKRDEEAKIPHYDVKELGFDPMKGVPTPGAGPCPTRFGEKMCGFNGGLSGLCSQCYYYLSVVDKIMRCKEQLELQVERNKKLAEDEARAAEIQATTSALEQKRRAEAAGAQAKLEAENLELKKAGKCYLVRPLDNQNWNLWGFDKRGPRLHVWSCGTCSNSTEENHAGHSPNDWQELHDGVEKLSARVAPIIESSDGNYPWAALYFSAAHMMKSGITDADSTEVALRKVLQLPAATQFAAVTKLAPSRKTLWEQSYYYDDHMNNRKLTACKQATVAFRAICDPKSIIHVRFSDDLVVYPVIIAGMAKKSNCLVMAYGTRADT